MRAFNSQPLTPPKSPQYDEIAARFHRFSRVELEIGAGNGMHALLQAQKNPHTLVIAVERTRNKFEAFQRNKKNLENLISINADIIPWLSFLNPKIQFHKIWILYPNPEMKRKNRRWIRAPFFAELLKRLNADGEIEMATNLSDYAVEALDKAKSIWGLQSELSEINEAPRTQFEIKYRARGEPCFRILIRSSSL